MIMIIVNCLDITVYGVLKIESKSCNLVNSLRMKTICYNNQEETTEIEISFYKN